MLEVKNINVYYDKVQALWDISFYVDEGEIVTLLGSNGVGKTTTVNTIQGIIKPASGKIRFHGEELQNQPPYKIVEKGVAMVPEGRAIFPKMTVLENLILGAYNPRARENLRDNLDKVFALFPQLSERKKQLAGTMSGGEQQMLAIGRALMSKPRLLILDEPSLGLAPVIVLKVFEIIEKLNKTAGVTILLVEQNIHHALEASDRAYVLEKGRIVREGKAKELLEDDYIKNTYLGL